MHVVAPVIVPANAFGIQSCLFYWGYVWYPHDPSRTQDPSILLRIPLVHSSAVAVSIKGGASRFDPRSLQRQAMPRAQGLGDPAPRITAGMRKLLESRGIYK